jgi:NAD(P)-dependent dehydrogenase (short-subunit alcohol dehydrogenase family)
MEWPDIMTAYKVAIITGASRGVGAGLATAYRRRGWAVTASADAIRPPRDDDLLVVPGDITEPAAAARVVDAALDRFGRIDTLVNNASTVISRPFTDYTAADFATVVGAGIAAFFWLTQRAIAEMAVRYGGHVVTVSATVAPAAPSGTPSVLAALASGGIAAATRSLAVEYAACGIRVNAVSAGLIQTPVTPANGFSGPGSWLPPLGRASRISDVVDGVLFLESASSITGEILHIDGGQNAEDGQV